MSTEREALRARLHKVKLEHEHAHPRRGGGKHGNDCMCWWHREGWLIHELERVQFELTITQQAIRVISEREAADALSPSSRAPDERDAQRYRRLRILGAAPGGSKQLDQGAVLRAQSLDAFVDDDLLHHASRGEAASSRADAEGWQPIATAPKDGQTVLGYTPGASCLVGDVYWCGAQEQWQRLPFDGSVYPTHWMPLPAPPEGE